MYWSTEINNSLANKNKNGRILSDKQIKNVLLAICIFQTIHNILKEKEINKFYINLQKIK
jgi:hypothetical protein